MPHATCFVGPSNSITSIYVAKSIVQKAIYLSKCLKLYNIIPKQDNHDKSHMVGYALTNHALHVLTNFNHKKTSIGVSRCGRKKNP